MTVTGAEAASSGDAEAHPATYIGFVAQTADHTSGTRDPPRIVSRDGRGLVVRARKGLAYASGVVAAIKTEHRKVIRSLWA
ncbi:hypothetical protein [Microbacterium cremeum]|uniref:hypothetical protein n=1 Tax=Microbacterium cremeum TaxID=2782169 RepID=UPI0018873A3A|nr:hypothetical protein [Microbacterium cremeum]